MHKLPAFLTRDAPKGARITSGIPQPGAEFNRLASVVTIDKDKRTIELSFSSEIEVKRWPGFVEVLDHGRDAVDLSRLNARGPLLFNHDLDKVVGVIESAEIGSDRKGRALVRFGNSERAKEVWQDVQDGILSNVSVGYRIHEIKLQESRENGDDIYVVTRWEPYEISIVSAPADTSVGVGRSVQTTQPAHKKNLMNRTQMIAWLSARGINVPADITDEDLTRKINEYQPPAPQPAPGIDPAALAAQALRQIEVGADHSAGATAERKRAADILAAGKQYGQAELAQEFVTSGRSVDEFRVALLEAVNKRNQQVADATKPIGLTDKEAQSFSFRKLLLALTSTGADAKRDAEIAKFELEVCQAAADKMHRSAKGLIVPIDVLGAVPLAGQRGTDTVSIKTGAGYTGTGGNTVQTQLLASSFIDLLRNRAVLMNLGSELSGLVGNIDIPRQITGSSASWIGEDADSTKEDMDFDLVSLRPKTVTNYAEVTRKMLMQSSLGVEALIRSDLARGLALAIDLKGFYGDGTNDTPTGIAETSGINANFWATDNVHLFSEFVAMETAIAQDNADVPSMAYVINPALRGYAKTNRKIATSTDSTVIWEPGNNINGYRAEVTNQVVAADAFFGNFADLLIGLWGGLDITVDPFTHSTKGRIRVVTFQDVDFAVRRPASFAWYSNNPA